MRCGSSLLAFSDRQTEPSGGQFSIIDVFSIVMLAPSGGQFSLTSLDLADGVSATLIHAFGQACAWRVCVHSLFSFNSCTTAGTVCFFRLIRRLCMLLCSKK